MEEHFAKALGDTWVKLKAEEARKRGDETKGGQGLRKEPGPGVEAVDASSASQNQRGTPSPASSQSLSSNRGLKVV